MADCDNAPLPQFPDRDTRVAIRFRAARFDVDRLAIARADAPVHVATSAPPRPPLYRPWQVPLLYVKHV